jgi:hypothetical protein
MQSLEKTLRNLIKILDELEKLLIASINFANSVFLIAAPRNPHVRLS